MAIAAIEDRQVHLGDRIEDKPGWVPLRKPLLDARRHQVLLAALARQEESLALFQRFGDPAGAAWSLRHLGDIARDRGNAGQQELGMHLHLHPPIELVVAVPESLPIRQSD